MRRFILLSLLILVFVFTGVAAAGGTTLNLVAYSTPKPVMADADHELAGDARQGRASPSPSRTAPRRARHRRSPPASPPTSSSSPGRGDVQILVDAGLVNENWNEQSYEAASSPNTVVVFASATATRRRSRAGTI